MCYVQHVHKCVCFKALKVLMQNVSIIYKERCEKHIEKQLWLITDALFFFFFLKRIILFFIIDLIYFLLI